MTKQIDLNKYTDFVNRVTSDESNNLSAMVDKLATIDNVNISLLMTAAIGLAAETGEFAELPKKIVFQGKPCDEDTIFHMKRELGDIMWYWVNACRALNLDPNDVILENVNKLESRYPDGEFDVHYSENRKDGDL
jgi:NTP pyrophosphatase (non-canonical NTP hydrolase)